ncbi:MAG: FAD-dependent oxidoreductase [Campylobacterota bacterium]|nr:FAD-dependent oxidoreductase [Campylobacterota bacterium]
MKKILILGGGFAGVECAIYLRKLDFNVTIVSDRDYLFVYPTSIWIPTRDASFEDNCLKLSALQEVHGFDVVVDSVSKIEAKNNSVTLSSGTIMSDYDYLVVAIGADKMKHKGIENTLSICGAPQQSLLIRDRLDELVKKGSGKISFGFGGNPKESSSVRGGPGFELLFNVHNMLKKMNIRDNFELTFFAPMAEPGKRMGPQALKMMDSFFSRLNINKHFGKKIVSFESDGVVFEDESKLDSDFTMFIPAGDGSQIVKDSDLPQNDAGFVKINDFCEVEMDGKISNVYAIGDTAAIEGPDWRAKQGHIAEVMARNTANNIAYDQNLKEKKEGYAHHLNILCVMDSGDGAAFVYRDDKRAMMIPMPVVGHWLKKGWGKYFKLSKLNKVPRIPGM